MIFLWRWCLNLNKGEKPIKTRTHHLIAQAADRYPFDTSTVTLIHSTIYSPNDIYAFTKDNKPYILRIATHQKNHTPQTAGEMEWLTYLHKHGIPVSMPLPMQDGQLVALLVSGDTYHDICAFEKAEGSHCNHNDPNTWNTEVIKDYGYTMGRMHCVTKDFTFSDERYARAVFDGSDALQESLSQAPAVRDLAETLVSQLLALPRTRDTFGLIHSDFHQNNFFVHNKKVQVFDFDDSVFGYFALDLGITLHHIISWSAPDEIEARQSEAERIITCFMEGYRRANTLDETTLRSIPLWMRFRQLCNFGWEYRADNTMPEEQYNLLHGYTVSGCRVDPALFM